MPRAVYALTHISAGDLLRAEVAAGTEYGKRVKSYMDSGSLVPDDVVITIVKDRLSRPDAQERGWLLDGYPRSASQAAALTNAGIQPELFILLEVPEDILVDRVAGRRMDPVTGKIYHLTYEPPESPEVAARLTQRSDDTEDKVCHRLTATDCFDAQVRNRLKTHRENVDAVLSSYQSCTQKVDGNRPKETVFADIDHLLAQLQESRLEEVGASLVARSMAWAFEHGFEGSPASQRKAAEQLRAAASVLASSSGSPLDIKKPSWYGIPTLLNTIPHTRDIRQYFYRDVSAATKNAVEAGLKRLKAVLVIPELNPEMDVYRIGTLMELLREMAFAFANDGKRVRVCVQGSMGKGIFAGMPLQLAGARRMLDNMDWGEYGAKENNFVRTGSVGANEPQEDDDIFIIMAPQNAVGNCIIDDLEGMVNAAGQRPVIIVNPRLKDIPSSGGVMQIKGREKRLAFVDSFFPCYHFRLLYTSGTQYPILGAVRRAYPTPYEVFQRVDGPYGSGIEEYRMLRTFDAAPSAQDIGDAFSGTLNGQHQDSGHLSADCYFLRVHIRHFSPPKREKMVAKSRVSADFHEWRLLLVATSKCCSVVQLHVASITI
eukprot:SM000098S25092  [mRNA]  locus=s98:116199:121868:- [translate_table: standard]